MKTIRIGTRGSALALWQAQRVAQLLDGPSLIKVLKTSGDKNPTVAIGDKNPVGFFTKEIERALLEFQVDVAVHSLKDLPIDMHSGLALGAVLERDDAGDILLVRPDALDADRTLPVKPAGTVGASALRRKALLAHFRADLEALPIRGNIPTRISKCVNGDYDALLISRAGPERLGLDVSPLLAFDLNPLWWPGSPGQATVAAQIRADDHEVMERIAALDHAETRQRVELERSLHSAYGGGCHTPFGAYCYMDADSVSVVLASLNSNSKLTLARFRSSNGEDVYQMAKEWIAGGSLHSNFDPAKEGHWLCRPAQWLS